MPVENDIRVCGCMEGGIGMLIGLAIFASIVMFDWTPLPAKGWRLVAVAIAFALFGGLLGKLVGILRASGVRQEKDAGPNRE